MRLDTPATSIALTSDEAKRAVTARIDCLADIMLGVLPVGALEKMLLECLLDRRTITLTEMEGYLRQNYPDCLVHEAGAMLVVRLHPELHELLELLPATFAKVAYLVHIFTAGFTGYFMSVSQS